MAATNIDFIRFGFFRKNVQCAMEYDGMLIGFTTSTKIGMIAPGIYDNGGAGFTDLTWFDANDFRMDRYTPNHLLQVLQANTIKTITLI